MKIKDLLLPILSISSVQAAVLADFQFDNPTGAATSLASSDADANSTAGTFGSGAGFNLNTTVVMNGFTSEGLGLSDGTADGLAGAIAANDYFTFTLTAAPGFTLDLDNITLDVDRANNGAQDFYVFTDVGGFTAGAQVGSALDIPASGSSINASLTAPAFSGLSSIEFRVYVDDRANNNNNSSATTVDNVVVNGTAVPIPEPSSAALLGLGGLALAARRKRA